MHTLRLGPYTLTPAVVVDSDGRTATAIGDLWALPGRRTATTEELAGLARDRGWVLVAPRERRFTEAWRR